MNLPNIVSASKDIWKTLISGSLDAPFVGAVGKFLERLCVLGVGNAFKSIKVFKGWGRCWRRGKVVVGRSRKSSSRNPAPVISGPGSWVVIWSWTSSVPIIIGRRGSWIVVPISRSQGWVVPIIGTLRRILRVPIIGWRTCRDKASATTTISRRKGLTSILWKGGCITIAVKGRTCSWLVIIIVFRVVVQSSSHGIVLNVSSTITDTDFSIRYLHLSIDLIRSIFVKESKHHYFFK
mmetsp:Transcript_31192/g.75020  ORF Transcript_31192/g.75020 Transcript_31192/m.75020 type:complete len:236 (+) Transcript_31192:3167-3874(+)